jgi:hypothetical protein
VGDPGEHPLFEHTRRALDNLRDVSAVPALAIRVEIAWAREPREIGLGGDDLAARTELINALCGMPVLAPRAPGGPPIRIRRGTAAVVRGKRHDGTYIEHALAPGGGDDAVIERRDAARAELADRELALARIDAAVPRFVRARPTGWRVLLWPIWWLLAWLRRGDLVQRAEAVEAAEVARRDAQASDDQLAGVRAGVERDVHAYAEAVRGLAAARDLLEVELEVTTERLAKGVELCEVGRSAASFDAIVLVEHGKIRAPGGAAIGTGDALAGLEAFASAARAMRLARRACKTIALTVATLDDQLASAEEAFDKRIAALEAQRLTEPATFIAAQLAHIRPQIVTSVSAVIEHASAHLGAELATLGAEWIESIASCASGDALKDAITQIETTVATSLQRIADETRTLVFGGGSGSAHDLYPGLVAPLVALGLPALPARRPARPLTPFAVLPSLATVPIAKLSGAWFGGLFRSFETRRTEIREKTHARIEQLRELASAELLDVEPELHAAIEQVLAPQLVAACERQASALDEALAAERTAIAAERARLAPVVEQQGRARATLVELRGELGALEAAFPACAASAWND